MGQRPGRLGPHGHSQRSRTTDTTRRRRPSDRVRPADGREGTRRRDPYPVQTIEITEATGDDAPPLRLLRIADTSNVNRLVDGQEIAFNARITVVYGENASGKTGYARVLKQVAGARSAGRVLPDVYSSSAATPTATIEFALGSEFESYPWQDGAPPVVALRRACVFDAPAAPLHVDDDLQYLYTPADIALFEYVHGALSSVRDLLTNERGRRAPKGNPFLSRFRRGTPQFALVESLRASTDLSELRRLAETVGDEESRVAALRDRVRSLESTDQQSQLAGARATQSLCGSALAVADRLLEFNPERYDNAIRDVAAAEKRVRDVSEALFAGDDLPGLFSAEWTEFIAAGHHYGIAHVAATFPVHATDCPYCGQTLDERSQELLRKYHTYLVDDSQATLRTAQQSLATLMSTVADMTLPAAPPANGNNGGAADGGGPTDAAVAVFGRWPSVSNSGYRSTCLTTSILICSGCVTIASSSTNIGKQRPARCVTCRPKRQSRTRRYPTPKRRCSSWRIGAPCAPSSTT